MDPVGDVPVWVLGEEPAVLRPGRHPGHVVCSADTLQKSGGVPSLLLARRRQETALSFPGPTFGGVAERSAPGDEHGHPQRVAGQLVGQGRPPALLLHDEHDTPSHLQQHGCREQAHRPAPRPSAALVEAARQPTPQQPLDDGPGNVAGGAGLFARASGDNVEVRGPVTGATARYRPSIAVTTKNVAASSR